MTTAKDLNDLSTIYLEAVYGGEKKKEEKKDTRYVVTSADVKGGTRAAKELAKGNPRYKKADHLKNSYEPEGEVIEAFKELTPDKKQQIKNQAARRYQRANQDRENRKYDDASEKDRQIRNMKKVSESGKFSPEEVKTILEVEGLGKSD